MRVFALVLAALACTGYARRVQMTGDQQPDVMEAEVMEELMSDDTIQAAERMEDALLGMSLDADKMTQVVADAKFQGEAARLVEPFLAVLEDPKVQEKARRVAKQMKAVMADASFAEEAKRIAEPIQALLAGAESQEQVTDVLEQMQALMADSSFQEQAKRIIEPMMGMMADPEFAEQAKHAVEQFKEVMGSPSFQKEAKRIAEPMKAMMENAQELQDTLESQDPQQSLASLLLASPLALNPTAASVRAASAPLQRARMPVASATDDIEAKTKSIIAEQLGVDEDKVTPAASFTEDLGADSLDAVELIMAIEEAFDIEIPDEEAEKMTTPADCVTAIKAKLG